MKVIASICFLVLAAYAIDAGHVSCRLSGDPHYKTWDGIYHDFQGKGVWQLAKSVGIGNQGSVEAQSQFIPCNLGAWNRGKKVTCMRSATIKITTVTGGRPPAGGQTKVLTIKWGSQGAQPAFPAGEFYGATPASPAVVDPVQISGEVIDGCAAGTNGWDNNCDVNLFKNNPITVMNGAYTINYLSGKLLIKSTADQDPIHFYIGRYYFLSYLPQGDDTYFGTNGLCGYNDGSCSNEFVHQDGTISPQATVCGRRYNNVNTNNWGRTFAVESGGPITPLAYSHHHEVSGFETLTVPDIFVPNATDQAAIDEVEFQNLATVEAANLGCKDATDTISQENCIFDTVAFIGAPNNGDAAALAQSNIAAKEVEDADGTTTSASSNTITDNKGVVAGIVVGCVAGVALIGLAITYHRLKRTQAQLSSALVLSGSNRNMGDSSGTSGEIRLADNL